LCGVAASVFTKLFLLIMKWRRSSKLHKKVRATFIIFEDCNHADAVRDSTCG
jgi:hypothetical protein